MKYTYLLLLLVFSFAARAQNLLITYSTDSLGDSSAITRIFVQSAGPDSLGLRAVNFSFAYRSDCASLDSLNTLLTDLWTPLLERTYEKKGQELLYGNQTYNQVHYYGIADPGMPQTHPLMAPPASGEPLLLLEVKFSGTCSSDIYLEDEKESPVNQQGDLLYNPVVYEMRRK